MDMIWSPEANRHEVTRAAALGFITQLLFQIERNKFRIAAIASQIWPAIEVGQYEILFNKQGKAVAYALWAFLADDVAAEVSRDDQRLLHISEWNEGTQLWIIDFVAPNGNARALVDRLRGRLTAFPMVHGLRYKTDGSIRKVVSLQPYRQSLAAE